MVRPGLSSGETKSLLTIKADNRLYTFSPETREELRKFRLGTSRAKDPQARICASLLHALLIVLLIAQTSSTSKPKKSAQKATTHTQN